MLINDYGEPQLSDFGIAHIEGGYETATGFFSGTIDYTAPEVMTGNPATVASDLYSLGATIYALIAGGAAHERKSGEDLIAQYLRISTNRVPDMRPEGIPDAVCSAIEKAMAIDPAERPASAEEFGRELQAAQRSSGLKPDSMAITSSGTGSSHTVVTPTGVARPPTGPPGGDSRAAGDFCWVQHSWVDTTSCGSDQLHLRHPTADRSAGGAAGSRGVLAGGRQLAWGARSPTATARLPPNRRNSRNPAACRPDQHRPRGQPIERHSTTAFSAAQRAGIADAVGSCPAPRQEIGCGGVVHGTGEETESRRDGRHRGTSWPSCWSSAVSSSADGATTRTTTNAASQPQHPGAGRVEADYERTHRARRGGDHPDRRHDLDLRRYRKRRRRHRTCMRATTPSSTRGKAATIYRLPVQRAMAVTWQGNPIVLGGWKTEGGKKVATDQVWRVVNSHWVELPHLLQPRAAAAAAVVGDRIIVTGGVDANGALLNTTEVFDGNSWTLGAPDTDSAADAGRSLGRKAGVRGWRIQRQHGPGDGRGV